MREFKFKAWDKGSKKIKNVTQLDFDHYEEMQIWLDNDSCSYFDDEIELMQYTGLKDRNGVEIYEGDILKLDSHFRIRIEWADGGFKVRDVDRIRYINKILDRHISDFVIDIWEIIGNIYENPELMEVDI